MRKKPVGGQVFSQLRDGNVDEAVKKFNQECEIAGYCSYGHAYENCVNMCLIPKLTYLSLGGESIEVVNDAIHLLKIVYK